VARAARVAPVVVLEADIGIDEHRDFDLDGLPGVTSARALMAARTNLAVQMALISRARFFMGTCGGLAWLAPFLGIPTVALYDADKLIAPHLYVARHAGARAGAADFTALDVRAVARLQLS
jgi:ADP-heptose:LPS heptosyltransferase